MTKTITLATRLWEELEGLRRAVSIGIQCEINMGTLIIELIDHTDAETIIRQLWSEK